MLTKKGWYLTLVMILMAVLYCPFFTIYSFSDEMKKKDNKEVLSKEELQNYLDVSKHFIRYKSFSKADISGSFVFVDSLSSIPTSSTVYTGDVPLTIQYGYDNLSNNEDVILVSTNSYNIGFRTADQTSNYIYFKAYLDNLTSWNYINKFSYQPTSSSNRRGVTLIYDKSTKSFYYAWLHLWTSSGIVYFKYDFSRGLFEPNVEEPDDNINNELDTPVSPDNTSINTNATQANFTQIIDGINNQNNLIHRIGNVIEIIMDNLVSGRLVDGSNGTFTFTGYVTGDSITYRGFNINYNQFSIENEDIKITSVEKTASFSMMLSMKFDQIINYFEMVLDLLSNWFYPLRNTDPLYWRTYNTNTSQQEDSNIAGVLYDITWYLGNLYVLQSANSTLNGMQDSIEDAKEQFQTVETQEVNIINSVKNKFNDFNPSSSDIGSLTALSWLSNLLQQIYVSLGSFGIAIICGLTLSLCMQFIGYFRYK